MPTGTVKPECGHRGPPLSSQERIRHLALTEFGYIAAQLEEQTVSLVFETQSSPGRSRTLSVLLPLSPHAWVEVVTTVPGLPCELSLCAVGRMKWEGCWVEVTVSVNFSLDY